jgi:uncharacterized protein (TIGR02001 family)
MPTTRAVFRSALRLLLTGSCVAIFGWSPPCRGADPWGGSVEVVSDYVERGVTKSDNHPALQLDWHYMDKSGVAAGAAVSSAQIDPHESTTAELSAFASFYWTINADWRGKAQGTYYAYPWDIHGSRYNYELVALDTVYGDWLDLRVAYSPNWPRIVPHAGIVNGPSISTEFNLQVPLYAHLSATAGTGYAHQGGAGAADYVYWSVGATYELAPISFILSYADTSESAVDLFATSAVRRRWLGSVMWRF